MTKDGSMPLDYLRQGGIDNNDLVVRTRLSEMLMNNIPAPGKYPIRFMAGNKELSSLVLEWKRSNQWRARSFFE